MINNTTCDHRRTCPVHNRKAVKAYKAFLEEVNDHAYLVWSMSLTRKLIDDGVPVHQAARVLPGIGF